VIHGRGRLAPLIRLLGSIPTMTLPLSPDRLSVIATPSRLLAPCKPTTISRVPPVVLFVQQAWTKTTTSVQDERCPISGTLLGGPVFPTAACTRCDTGLAGFAGTVLLILAQPRRTLRSWATMSPPLGWSSCHALDTKTCRGQHLP